MRLLRHPRRSRSRTRLLNRPGLIRLRLWIAMLGLALIPMVGVVLLEASFAEDPQVGASAQQAWATSLAVSELNELAGDLEARVLSVAADPSFSRLVDGIGGSADRQTAQRLMDSLGGSHPTLIRGACIAPYPTGAKVALASEDPSMTASSACGASALAARAVARSPGGLVRSTAWGGDSARRLLLTTQLSGSPRRAVAVLTVEVGLKELFAAVPAAGEGAAAAMLVDMTSTEIIADIGTDGVVTGSTSPLARPMGNLRVRVNGIVSGHAGTSRALASAGWSATAAPLWRLDDGAHLGIIHVWPRPPPTASTALLLALVFFALVVVVSAGLTARHFLKPFDDLAESQAQLEVLYREAREDSLHDGLTGLGNHRSFQEELDRQLDLYTRHKVPVALLLLDLDDLKVVNDGEGHPAGDRMLVGMSNAIRDALRYGDRAFRIGGDEFAVILPHTDASDALIAANRLRHFCLRPAAGDRVIPFSGGISSVPQLAADRNELFKQADAALYRCKRRGRGTVAIFDHDRDRVTDDPDGSGAVEAVREIVRGRNLTPVYQPIVDLRDGSVLGFEGLIRPGESAPFTNPGQLFAAAAAGGRTVELDLACFEVVAEGAQDIDPSRVVTVNLSPRTLEVQDYSSSWLLEILARYDLSPGRVIVELTEREDIVDIDRLRTNVAALQRAGVRQAADDVGAGNAGLRLLSQVRFDIVKIDLSLVQQGAQSDSSREVVRSLMELAARQGAIAIAEGVETAEQLNVLIELGITTGQGYLLGRPGRNIGLASVDIGALAAGTLIVQNVPAGRPAAAGAGQRPDHERASPEALQGSPA